MPMNTQSNSRLTLEVCVEHDGNYWVASCPALKMKAAHQHKAVAWMRASRMIPAQIIYALNQDPTLSGLMSPEHSDELETLRRFKRESDSFTLCLQQTGGGARFEIPDMLAAGC